ncbi:unnamed protein product, partial [Gulo gulo]
VTFPRPPARRAATPRLRRSVGRLGLRAPGACSCQSVGRSSRRPSPSASSGGGAAESAPGIPRWGRSGDGGSGITEPERERPRGPAARGGHGRPSPRPQPGRHRPVRPAGPCWNLRAGGGGRQWNVWTGVQGEPSWGPRQGEQALVLGLWQGTEAGRGKEREHGGRKKPSTWAVLRGCAWSLRESCVQQEEVWSQTGCGQGPGRAVARTLGQAPQDVDGVAEVSGNVWVGEGPRCPWGTHLPAPRPPGRPPPCVPSGFRGECPAGPHRGQAEHFHRDPLLDGPRGHRLRREPRRHLRLPE